jgi:hypothetical protein
MTLHRSKARPPGVARRFEPSRLAGAMLSSAYDALVPELRSTARAGAAATRPPARIPAQGRTANGG